MPEPSCVRDACMGSANRRGYQSDIVFLHIIERKGADVKRRIVLIVRIRDAQDLPTFSFIRRILLLQMKYWTTQTKTKIAAKTPK